jgi:hypothetical protein
MLTSVLSYGAPLASLLAPGDEIGEKLKAVIEPIAKIGLYLGAFGIFMAVVALVVAWLAPQWSQQITGRVIPTLVGIILLSFAPSIFDWVVSLGEGAGASLPIPDLTTAAVALTPDALRRGRRLLGRLRAGRWA